MRRMSGHKAVNDDEWYTSYETALKVATWLGARLPLETPILCPADILPDGTESAIPKAARDVGFKSVRVTRNLPLDVLDRDAWHEGEFIFTNPPFSLLVPFRKWQNETGAKFCILSRLGIMRGAHTINEIGERFRSTNGKTVCAAWFQNIENTENDLGEPIGDCAFCERKACPKNELTGDWIPGKQRKLYGAGTAVKNGTAGFHCRDYTVNGKRAFTRYFHSDEYLNRGNA